MDHLCIVSGCDRKPDVRVTGRIGGSVYYCRRHAYRWELEEFVPQPAVATVLAGRFWDASRRSGAKRRTARGDA